MKLIDADALIRKRNHAKAYAQDMYVIGQGCVMDAPTIDAVPVVRCGECRKKDSWECPAGDYLHSDSDSITTVLDKDDFCSQGTRADAKGVVRD